ncbi:MAG: FkbM family methyltransferase [Chitinophagaceae bacterium]|nr:FkbM family methyltransferase [Chitinophagaceae bacterium]
MGISQLIKKIFVKTSYGIWGKGIIDELPMPMKEQKEWDAFINLSFSQEGEDLVLYRLLGHQTKGLYVDVGAHHPYRFSNTFKFYLLGWRGINIDPLPGSKKILDEKRPGDINIEAGVLNRNGEALTYYMFQDPAYNTFDETVAAQRQLPGSDYIFLEKKQIACYRLADILEKHLPKNTSIDFLSIDVEGMDLEVLQSNNWELYRPRYIIAESLSTKLAEEFNAPISVFLQQQGYELTAKTANSLLFTDKQQNQQ